MGERGPRRPVFEDVSGQRARRVRLLVLPLLLAAGTGGAMAFASVTAPSRHGTVNALPLSTPRADPSPHSPFALSIIGTPPSAPPEPCSKLSGVVFTDHDRNGARQAHEPGVAGLAVGALTEDATLVAETVTSPDGRWSMSLPTPQVVRLVTWSPNASMHPAPRGVDSDPWASPATTPRCGADLAMVWDEAVREEGSATAPTQPMELGDRVWSDDDCDGWQDPLEPGLVGVRVRLQDSDGAKLAETITNSAGEFLFGGIHPNRLYRVEIIFDGAYALSPERSWITAAATQPRLRDAFGSSDSDGVQAGPAQAVAERSVPIAGASDHSIDFGLVRSGASGCGPTPPDAAPDPSAS